ncbi:hypothetical protein [Haladaptatus sp. NG-SE-30]
MNDDDPPLTRVRRAKSHQSPTSLVDGGAIAVGMVVALGVHLIPAGLSLVETSSALLQISALASTMALPVGSHVTGRYAGGDWERGGVHGLSTATGSLAILGGAAVAFVGAERAVDEFGRMLGVGAGIPVLAGVVVGLLFAGIVAGALGAKRRERR